MNKKPKSQKILQGTFRRDRDDAPKILDPVTEARKPPAHLNKYAKAFWREVSQELIEQQVLTVVDWAAFEICADAYGTYRELDESIRSQGGLSAYFSGGNSQTVPEYTALNKAIENFHKYSKSLGLNPAARQRLNIVPVVKEEVDPMEELLDSIPGN